MLETTTITHAISQTADQLLTTTTAGFPVLSLLIISLPVAALSIWLNPDPKKARWIALITAMAGFILSLWIVFQFDSNHNGFQFVEQTSWIPSLKIDYIVGVDGISVLFLPLTILLFIGIILASWTSVRTMPKLYFTLLMILQSATLGIFISLNTILFYPFFMDRISV